MRLESSEYEPNGSLTDELFNETLINTFHLKTTSLAKIKLVSSTN